MSETKKLPNAYLEQMLANCSEEEITEEISNIIVKFLDGIKDEPISKKLGVVAFMSISAFLLVIFAPKNKTTNKQN